MFTNVYQTFYILIHFMYTVFEYIFECFLDVFKTFQYKFTVKGAKKRVLQLKKKPKHLTVLLNSENADFKDLANLIMWSLRAEIPFISFFDHRGELKKHEDKLMYEVSKLKTDKDYVIWHTDHEKESGFKNGFTGNKIHVKILAESDGRLGIVNVTRELAEENCRDITIEKLNSRLLVEYEFPDPDMGLMCGDALTLFNYPPWQARLTEFFQLKNVKGVRFPVFLELLLKFSKCEQRLGK